MSLHLELTIGTGQNKVVASTGGGGSHYSLGQVSQLPARGIDVASGLTGSSLTVSFNYRKRPDYNLLDQPAVLMATDDETGRRYELFRGVTDSPNYDPDLRNVSLTIRDKAPTADVAFPPNKIGDPLRFPNAPLANRDFAVPILFGTNRDVPLAAIDDPENEDVDNDTPIRLLVAGHTIVSTQVDIVDDAGVLIPNGPYPVSVSYDGAGGEYCYVVVLRANYQENLYAAKVVGFERAGVAVDGLGDVLDLLFKQWGGGFVLDENRTSRAKADLNRWSVGLRFDSQTENTTLADVVSSRIGDQFPVVFGYLNGRFGWDSLIWPDLNQRPARHFVMYRNCHSTGEQFVMPKTEVLNNFRLSFSVSGRVGGDTRFVDIDAANSVAANHSISRFGKSARRDVSYPDHAVLNDDDDSQATALANEQIRSEGFRRWTATYLVDDFSLVELPLMTVVLVTDPRMQWVSEPAVVVTVEPLPTGMVKVTLAVDD